MTEVEWLSATDPTPLLESLDAQASNRQLRRFACACCLRIARLLTADHVKYARKALELFERHLEGVASEQELQSAWEGVSGDAISAGHIIAHPGEADYYAICAAADAVDSIRRNNTASAAAFAASAIAYDILSRSGNLTLVRITSERKARSRRQFSREQWNRDEQEVRTLPEYEQAFAAEQQTQCAILRDIVGNPFRRVAFDPLWFTSTVVALAQQMYDSRDFSAMPILADALQDAGCDNADILDHCRLPSEHVRGCWVVDALLGKA